MIYRNYTVAGEDVNDTMMMENKAYVSYSIRLLYHYLFHNGFSRQKLTTLHLDLQENNHELVCYQNLMFTQPFLVLLKHCRIDEKISIKTSFFNAKDECCAEVTATIECVDPISRESILVPKQILRHFNTVVKKQSGNYKRPLENFNKTIHTL